jgi:ubiquitin-protein ligase
MFALYCTCTCTTDGGGSIDVDELQALVTAFGGKISRDEAQAMLDEYDMDGGGTIDFTEFMVLIYKIQRGTIDLATSDLAQVLVEAKSQLKIFEEIEEVGRHPPEFCSVSHFGGSPVACNFTIQGPTGSPYEGAEITLQMVFFDGYPYRQPDVQFQGRVISLHVLPQLSGDARLLHIKEIWNSEWNMRKLLLHTVDVLLQPDPDMLTDKFHSIYTAWEAALRHTAPVLEAALRKEAAARVRNAVQARELARVNRDKRVQELQELRAEKKAAAAALAMQVANAPIGGPFRATPLVPPSPALEAVPEPEAVDPVAQAESAVSAAEQTVVRTAEEAAEAERLATEEEVLAELRRRVGALSMDELSDEATRKRILALSRIEKMHLGTMLMHLVDLPKYNESIRTFMKKCGPSTSLNSH